MRRTWSRLVLVGAVSLGLLALFTVLSTGPIIASSDNGDPDLPPPPMSWNIHLVSELSGGANVVHLVDDLLYVGSGDKLVILDVSDPGLSSPGAPAVIGALLLPERVNGIDVAGNYAFVAADDAGLIVVDVSDPTDPRVAAATPGLNDAVDVDVVGAYAYVADANPYLRVVNVSDPYSPTVVGSFRPEGSGWYISSVAVSGTVAYVGYSHRLLTVDVTTPTQPVELGGIATRAYDTVLVGGEAYVAAGSDGLRLLDISDPTTPISMSIFDTSYSVFASAISGTTAYVAAGATGLMFVDYTEPLTPTEISRLDTPGVVQDVALAWPHAFVADSSRGVRILDVDAPQETGAWDLPSASRCVAITGTHAFVGEYYYSSGASESLGTLRAIDLSVPMAPTQTSIYTLPERGIDIVIQGPYAYVAADRAGLQIIDVSDPGAPAFMGEALPDIVKLAMGVAVSDTTAYVVYGNGGLYLNDVTDVTSPTKVSRLAGDYVGVALRGNHAFLTGPSGMWVADVSQPLTPTVVATYSLGYTPDVVISDTLAYLAAGDGGLHIVDITDALSPTQVSVFSEIEANSVSIWGDRLYVTAGDPGFPDYRLVMLDVSSPSQPRMMGYRRDASISFRDSALLARSDADDPYIVVAGGGAGVVVYEYQRRIYLPMVVRN